MVRLELQPLLTPAAEALLSTYYQQQRQAADRSAARTTIRMLESAIRLSQAHARLCFRSSVVVLDACVAISLLEGKAPVLPAQIVFYLSNPVICKPLIYILPAAASEKQTQMGGGGHAMHGHVSTSTRRQGAGVSQVGLADPNEAAGAAGRGVRYSTHSSSFPAADLVVRVVTALGLHKVLMAVFSGIWRFYFAEALLMRWIGGSMRRAHSPSFDPPGRMRALAADAGPSWTTCSVMG